MSGSADSNIAQIRPNELVDILRPDFQHRNEPNFAAKSLVSAYSHLYGNRGIWYAGDCDESLHLPDLTGQGRTLYNVNTAQLNVANDIVAITRLETSDYLYRLDEPGLSITATETHVPAGRQGIALGGWWRFAELGTHTRGLMSKWTAGLESYLLSVHAANTPQFHIENGVGAQDSVGSSVVITMDRYYFIHACLDKTDGQMRIFVGDSRGNFTMTEAATTHVDIADTTALFQLGSYWGGTTYHLNGWMSICHLAAANQDEAEIRWVWEQTRAMYPPTV